MRAKIGVADADRVISAVFEDVSEFEKSISDAFDNNANVFWVTDEDQNHVAIPVRQIAWIEVEPSEKSKKVGFGD